MSRRRIALLLAAAAAVRSTAVDGEVCGRTWVDPRCRANQDFMLVVDLSSSIATVFDAFLTFLKAFADELALEKDEGESPRIGLVSFFGYGGPLCDMYPEDCAACHIDSAAGSGCLSSDPGAFRNAINSLRKPDAGVLTCISCGIEVAHAELRRGRVDGRGAPLMIVLTDGDQTCGGTEAKAVDMSTEVKADGSTIVTIGMTLAGADESTYRANKETLLALASFPKTAAACSVGGSSAAAPSCPTCRRTACS